MDLDGANHPAAFITAIFKHEPTLAAPIPVEELAGQLDIVDIKDLTTDGFEGGLITDKSRSEGFILVNREARRGRRRFTIAHELGHFLMIHHEPPRSEGFLCSREDMLRGPADVKDRYSRMEAEANLFAGSLLMPPRLLQSYMSRYRQADIADVMDVARDFDVSREVAARNYAQFHAEPAAALVVKDGVLLRAYKGPRFPWLAVKPGESIPAGTVFRRRNHALHVASRLEETRSGMWLETRIGERMPDLFEQVLLQQDGYALILLVADIADDADNEEEDEDDRRTSKERLNARLARRSGLR